MENKEDLLDPEFVADQLFERIYLLFADAPEGAEIHVVDTRYTGPSVLRIQPYYYSSFNQIQRVLEDFLESYFHVLQYFVAEYVYPFKDALSSETIDEHVEDHKPHSPDIAEPNSPTDSPILSA